MPSPAAQAPEAAAPPSGAQLRALTRAARRGHGGAPLRQLIGDVYTYAFCALVGVALAVSAAHVLGADFSAETARTTSDPGWLWFVGSVALGGLALGVLARLGPVGVGAAGSLWWLPTPVDRLTLLRPVAGVWVAGTAVVGAVGGAMLAALTHADPVTVVAALVAGGGLGGALAAGVATTQTVPLTPRAVRRLALAGDAAVAVAVLAWLGVSLAGAAAPSGGALLVAGLAVVLFAGAQVLLLRRLPRIPGAELRARGARAGMATFAITMLDFRELGRVLTDPGQDRRRRTVSMAWVRGPRGAVVTADALLLSRAPRQLVMVLVSLGLPIAVAGAGTSEILAAGAFVVGAYLAANAVAVGARGAEFAPALDRAFGLGARTVRALRLVVPSLVLLAWALLAVATLRGLEATWVVLLVAFVPALAASAVKAAYRKPPNWAAPLVVTPMGAYPPGVVNSLLTGPILALVASLPVVVALFVGAVVPVVVMQLVVTAILVAVAVHVQRRK